MHMEIQDLAIVIGFLFQFGGTVWWASSINTNQKTMGDQLAKITYQIEEHDKLDRVFQIETIKALSKLIGEQDAKDT